MSVYSMTGFASAVAWFPTTSVKTLRIPTHPGVAPSAWRRGAEIRSVNSRFLDLSFKAGRIRSLEPVLRELRPSRSSAARLNCACSPSAPASLWPQPQTDQSTPWLVWARCRTGCPRRRPVGQRSAQLVPCRCARKPNSTKLQWKPRGSAIEALIEARKREGKRLVGILNERIEGLRALAEQAVPLVPQAVQRQQSALQKFQEAIATAGGSVTPEAAQERALSEAAASAPCALTSTKKCSA